MDLNKSGGPAYPTLNGAVLDDNTFRFEGLTLFDFYVGQLLLAGESPAVAVGEAKEVMALRTAYLTEDKE
jgi:hypothetical protein